VELKYLIDRREQSHAMALTAACQCSRAAHTALAKAYGKRVDQLRIAAAHP